MDESSGFLTYWKAFVSAVQRKLCNSRYTLPGGKLSKLVQTSSVIEYQNRFEEMCTRCLGLADNFILEMFISGLKEDIQKDVIKAKPQDLQKACDVAILIEGLSSPKSYGAKPRFTKSFKSQWSIGV